MLLVKEIFGPTIQGEGAYVGMPSIFIRFGGCNMWNGKLEDREKSKCPYCDTDFDGGEKMTPTQIWDKVTKLTGDKKYLIVFTGGEPLLQDSSELKKLVHALSLLGHQTQIETNGTIHSDVLMYIDYVVCSPKVPFEQLAINKFMVDCWKILYPHPVVTLEPFVKFVSDQSVDFMPEGNLGESVLPTVYLQPITDYKEGSRNLVKNDSTYINTTKAYLKVQELGLPWKLSVQMHKIIGVE